MKGAFPLLIFVLMGMAIVAGVVATNIFVETESIRRSARDASILEAINSMEMMKRSLNLAMAYSLYQASYDASASGGSTSASEDTTYWRTYGQVSVPAFESNIESRSLSLLGEYVSQLGDFGLDIPEYQSLDLRSSREGLVETVASSNGRLMLAAQDGTYEIEDIATMTRTVRSNIFHLFEEPIKVFAQPGDKVRDLAIDTKQKSKGGSEWPDSGSETRGGCGCGSPSSCISDSEVFEASTGYSVSGAESAIDSYMEGQLESLSDNSWLPSKYQSVFETTVTERSAASSIDIVGCAADVISTQRNFQGQCVSTTVRKTCDFEYYIAGDVKLSVKDELKFSVFDSTSDRRNTVLNFAVKSCNVYSSKCPL
jgi:hypothetical protein